MRGADALLVAAPSQSVRAHAAWMREAIAPHTLIVHATKGLERGTAKRVSEILCEELPQIGERDICALSGPNLAGEIARGLPAATVVAGTNPDSVERAQALFHGATFRVYASDDLVGLELAGSLKNVVAIVAGMADGLAFGDNAKAGIITRGLAEVTRLGVAAGARPATFAGLAGIGDVMATSYSALSRNRSFGEAVARGAPPTEAEAASQGVVEGVAATSSALILSQRLGVEMPITSSLHDVLFAGATPLSMVERLLAREAKQGGD